MLLPFAFNISQYILGPLLFLLSLFIILIVLLQRGRGGGLAGALGGAGGSSALGVKAGDIFTRITAVAVLIWIVLCAFVCWFYLEPPPDIAVDPSSDTPALTVGPKDGVTSGGAGSAAAGDEAKSEVVSPAVPVLPTPTEAPAPTDTPKPVEEGKPAETAPGTEAAPSAGVTGLPAPTEPPVNPTPTSEPPAAGLPPANGGAGNPTPPPASGSAGDGK